MSIFFEGKIRNTKGKAVAGNPIGISGQKGSAAKMPEEQNNGSALNTTSDGKPLDQNPPIETPQQQDSELNSKTKENTQNINELKVDIADKFNKISNYNIDNNINNIKEDIDELSDKLNKLINYFTNNELDNVKSIYEYAKPCTTLLQGQIKVFSTLYSDKVNNLSKCVNFDTKNGLSLNSCPVICNNGINLVDQIFKF